MLSLSVDDRFGYLSTVGPIPDPKPRPRRAIDLHRSFLTLLAVTSGMLAALTASGARRPAEYRGRLRWLAPALQHGVASQPVAFAWTPVVGADVYRLRVGSEPGAHDLVRSGWLRETHYTVDGLPGGRPLYARVLARRPGAWAHADLVFVASRQVAEWVHPKPGSADADPGRAIEWTPIPEADEYSIAIGTMPGLFDLVSRSTGRQTSWLPGQLPVGRRLVGRLGTRIGTTWRFSDADFAIGLGYRQALPIFPVPSQYTDPRRPFVWSADPMASGYRLRIGSAEGRSDLYDSGPIGVTGRFVEGLPPGRRLFATLTTLYADRALDAHFAFQAGTGSPGEREAIQAALDVTVTVRGMAGYDAAWPRTILERVVRGLKADGPGCVEFAHALLQALADQRNPLPARSLATCLLGNSSDCHTLVELYLPSRGRGCSWIPRSPSRRDAGATANGRRRRT